MKKLHTILAGILLVTTVSCERYLDVLPDNRTELNSEQAITKMLVSAYPTSHNAAIGEQYSDNFDENDATYSYFELSNKQLYSWQETFDENQDTPHFLWESCYSAIASANQALAAIEKLGNPVSLAPQKGEALLCRAYGHFLLATTFCQAYSPLTATKELGIPYMTEPETEVLYPTDRGTLQKTYEMMAKDIEMGLPLIDDVIYMQPKYHFNRKAAYAFAARFYLYFMQTDFSNCKKVVEYANQVLGNSPADVLKSWSTIASLTPNGDVQPNAYVDSSSPANLLLLSCASYWPAVADPGYGANQRYCNNETTSKETCRSTGPWGVYTNYKQSPFTPGSSIKNGFRRLALYMKFSTDGSSFHGYMLIPAFTTDETLLNRSEAYALLQQYDLAAADLDTWQKSFTTGRVTLTKDNINDFYAKLPYYNPKETANPSVKKRFNADFTIQPGMQENLLHCVLHARRLLTLEEGTRWQDIKRYGIEIYRRRFSGGQLVELTDKMVKGDRRRAIQIPATVVAAGMKPNPKN